MADANRIWTANVLRNGEYEVQFSDVSASPTSEFGDVGTLLAHRHQRLANERKNELEEVILGLQRWGEPQRTLRTIGAQLVYALLEEDLSGFREYFEKLDGVPSDEELTATLSRHFDRSDYREFRISDVFNLGSMSVNLASASRCELRIPVTRTFSRGKLSLPNPITFELHQARPGQWHLTSLKIDPDTSVLREPTQVQ